MKMERSMAKQVISKDIALKLIKRRVDSHNNRFAGVAGKKADYDLVLESFNRGCFREKSMGESDENLIIKAGFRRLKDFFYILLNGYPRLGGDIVIYEDYDILPKGHRMHSKAPTYHLTKYDFFTNSTDVDGYRLKLSFLD